MANDNGSFWKGYLGYPAIAYLMKIGVLSYDPKIGDQLKGIAWKDINQKLQNNFDATLEYVLSSKTHKEREQLANFVDTVDEK